MWGLIVSVPDHCLSFYFSFGEVYHRYYDRKLRFTAPLTHRRKTNYPTLKPTIYLPKWPF